MTLWRTVWRSTRGRMLLGAALLAIVWQLWLSVDANAKTAAGLTAGTGKVDLLVTLRFPPEQFHLISFQRYGRVSGTQDRTLELRGVRKTDVPSVARPYWVLKVQPLPTEGTT